MPDLYTKGTTTAFVPRTECLDSSNLWLTAMPCGTQWSGHRSDTPEMLDPPICTVTLLGLPDGEDHGCYSGYHWPEVNDCPVGMTSVHETTRSGLWKDGMKSVTTFCCPETYEFATRFDAVPPAGKDDYDIMTTFFCRADSVKTLSDQTATLTVSTDPLITTEVAWDYEQDYIYAYSAEVGKIVYEASGTTSECFAFDCPRFSNPLTAPTPTPTPTPTRSYIPPPSHPTTQFTPAPSCIGDSNMYLVSTSCQIVPDRAVGGPILTPDWLECSITEFGEWNTNNEACFATKGFYPHTTGDDGTASFYAGCPVGYTTAFETVSRPYDVGRYTQGTQTESFDVVVTSVGCCPTGDYSFMLSDVHTTSTSRPDGYEYVNMYPMPRCVVQYVESMFDKSFELTLATNNAVWDKRKRQEVTQGPEVTTRLWNVDAFLFAEAAGAAVTVFHGTYSCYENCDDYFTSSYNNTDPNYTPTSTTASSTGEAGEGEQGDATQTGQGEATQASGTSGTVKIALFGKDLGPVALVITILSGLI